MHALLFGTRPDDPRSRETQPVPLITPELISPQCSLGLGPNQPDLAPRPQSTGAAVSDAPADGPATAAALAEATQRHARPRHATPRRAAPRRAAPRRAMPCKFLLHRAMLWYAVFVLMLWSGLVWSGMVWYDMSCCARHIAHACFMFYSAMLCHDIIVCLLIPVYLRMPCTHILHIESRHAVSFVHPTVSHLVASASLSLLRSLDVHLYLGMLDLHFSIYIPSCMIGSSLSSPRS